MTLTDADLEQLARDGLAAAAGARLAVYRAAGEALTTPGVVVRVVAGSAPESPAETVGRLGSGDSPMTRRSPTLTVAMGEPGAPQFGIDRTPGRGDTFTILADPADPESGETATRYSVSGGFHVEHGYALGEVEAR